MNLLIHTPPARTPWNKGKLVGQKPALKLKEIWAIRIRLQITNRVRDLIKSTRIGITAEFLYRELKPFFSIH